MPMTTADKFNHVFNSENGQQREKSSHGKRPYIDFNCSFSIENVGVSLYNKTTDERR